MVVMPDMKVSFDSDDEVEMHVRRGDVHPCAAQLSRIAIWPDCSSLSWCCRLVLARSVT